MRDIHAAFDRYAADHRNPANLAIHCVCIPVVAWSVIAALWTVPPGTPWVRPGVWAVLAMFAAYFHYHRTSRNLGYAMAVAFIAGGALAWKLYDALGPRDLLGIAIGLFMAGWIGLCAGHTIEGRPGAVMADVRQFLVGPAWLMARLLRRCGITQRDE